MADAEDVVVDVACDAVDSPSDEEGESEAADLASRAEHCSWQVWLEHSSVGSLEAGKSEVE